MKTYDEFLAEEYEVEDQFWKEMWEDLEAEYWLSKNQF